MIDKEGHTSYSKLAIIVVKTKNSFNIYPNPAHSIVTIDCPVSSKNAQLMITDMSGKLLKKQQVNNQKQASI